MNYPSLTGKIALVTGTGGLGFEAAKALALLGAQVTIAGRNPDKGDCAVAQIRQTAPDAQVQFELLDLADLASVRALAGRLDKDGQRLDILINNAGIMMPRQLRRTVDGFEDQFGTNHLGHFALTALLLPMLLRSDAARVISVTSLAHRQGALDFDNLLAERQYQAGLAYCQSKLAVALFARELQRRADARGWPLVSLAAHPGFAGTNLFAAEQGSGSLLRVLSERVFVPLLGQSAEAGAWPLVHAAASPEIIGGMLYGPTGLFEMRGKVGECSYGKGALDEDAARRLWELSEKLCGLTF